MRATISSSCSTSPCNSSTTARRIVCSLSAEEIRTTRGTLSEPGRDSPYRNRSVAESLDLLRRMRAGEFPDGAHVLRARIDMASPNVNMRDPVLYRIRHTTHQRTGDAWCIYPTYDFTHCICDALEGITHSLCTLEFEDHRPLYDWVLDNINVNFHPPQIEFSRLGLEYTVMSKRLLHQLVTDRHVAGWDDPRMPTIAGLRRRGVTPAAIRDFCSRIGVTKQDNVIELSLLEFCIRKDLEATAPRGMAVIDPLKVTITNYPGDDDEKSVGAVASPTGRHGRAAVDVRPRSSTSSATTLRRCRRRNTSGWCPAGWCGCATASSSAATTSSKTRPALSSNCAAAMCRSRRAAPTPAA